MRQDWIKKTVQFLLSQTVSLFGSSLVQYAIIWHITLETKSGVMTMLSIIFGFLPMFFVSPFAGVWADRYSRKMLIVFSDALIAVSTLVLAILFAFGYGTIWLLLLLSAVRSFGTGIQVPAVGAILPQIVPEDKLMRINAINGSIQSVITLISPMASGLLLTFSSIEAIFLIDVGTAAIAIFILIALLNVPLHSKASQKPILSYFADLRLGVSYVKSHGYLIRFFAFSAVFFILVSPAALLTPLQVARSYGEEVWRLSAIEIAFSGGMVLGGILIASWGGFKNRIHTMAFAGVAFGVFTFGLGAVSMFWLYLVIMGLAGFAVPIYNTPSTVMLQESVEESYLGRIFGIFGMIPNAVMPLGMLIFGPLSEVIKIEWLLIGTGILICIVFMMMPCSKVLIKAGLSAKKSDSVKANC